MPETEIASVPELEEPHASGAAEARSDLQVLGKVTNRNDLRFAHLVRTLPFLSGTSQKQTIDRRHILEIEGLLQSLRRCGWRVDLRSRLGQQNFIKERVCKIVLLSTTALSGFQKLRISRPLQDSHPVPCMIGSDLSQVPKFSS